VLSSALPSMAALLAKLAVFNDNSGGRTSSPLTKSEPRSKAELRKERKKTARVPKGHKRVSSFSKHLVSEGVAIGHFIRNS